MNTFWENLARFRSGEEFESTVDVSRGY